MAEPSATGALQASSTVRLATTETYLDRNNTRQERTEWHSVTVWVEPPDDVPLGWTYFAPDDHAVYPIWETAQSLGIPVRSDLVRRVQPTRTQTQLDKHARADNVRHAFAPARPQPLRGERLLVLDEIAERH